MSHLVRVHSRLTDETLLCKALEKLSMTYSQQHTQIYGVYVDIVLEDKLGLAKQPDGSWMLIGDPYYTNRYEQFYGRANELIGIITAAYMSLDASSKLTDLGFVCTSNEEAAVNTTDGKIQMVFERGY